MKNKKMASLILTGVLLSATAASISASDNGLSRRETFEEDLKNGKYVEVDLQDLRGEDAIVTINMTDENGNIIEIGEEETIYFHEDDLIEGGEFTQSSVDQAKELDLETEELDLGVATLISVSLDDEDKFTEEE